MAAKNQQPTTIMMASTAYGGSVEQGSIVKDILTKTRFQRFNIQTQAPTAIHQQLAPMMMTISSSCSNTRPTPA